MPFGGLAPLPFRLGGSDTEGVSPEQHARLAADLEAVGRTMPLFVMRCDPTTSPPTVNFFRPMWSKLEGVSGVTVTVTDETTYAKIVLSTPGAIDNYGQLSNLNPLIAIPQYMGADANWMVKATIESPTEYRVYGRDIGGAVDGVIDFTLVVF